MNNLTQHSLSNLRQWMYRAIQLASLAEGETSPNPLVGSIILDESNQLVGEGFHSKAGSPHAEIGALKQAGQRAKGGTLLVTLEPCCHHGRTPPCVEEIIRAGIKEVIVAHEDPDPRVSGGGIARLKEAGINVFCGLMKEEAAYQNRAFFFRVRYGRPWGILKWAMSLDGRIALPNGESKWISCERARRWVHHLRAKTDAVIVGGGTVRSDNPHLNTRGIATKEPLRVVLTRTFDLPLQANLWNQSASKTLIAYKSSSFNEKFLDIEKKVDFLPLEDSQPENLMTELASRNCNQVLWECGPKLATEALKQGCVQEIAVIMSPKILGGKPAKTPLDDFGMTSMDQVLLMKYANSTKLGNDWLFNMYCPTGEKVI